MSWRFSKSIKIGPIRLNFSKNGMGWSIGGKGFRAGVDSKSRKYNHISIPGTGISKRSYEESSNTQQSSLPSKQISWIVIIGIAIGLSILRAFLR